MRKTKNDYDRKVPAARKGEIGFFKETSETTPKAKRVRHLTSKQLAVYYWLISKSYYNSEKREEHYFVYRNQIVYAQVARELGIGSVNTIKTALEKLELHGKICITDDIIYIPHAQLYTYLHIDLIKYLLAYSTVLGAELLLFYGILKRVFELDKKRNEKTHFNIKLFLILLGHNEHDTIFYKLYRVYIDFLEKENLIKVSRQQKRNAGGEYTDYTLWNIERDLPLSLYIEEEGEQQVIIKPEVIQRYQEEIDKIGIIKD